MTEVSLDLLNSDYGTIDDAMSAIAQDMIAKHPLALECEINWKVNTLKGVVDFTIVMHHIDHHCRHLAAIPYVQLSYLNKDGTVSDINKEDQDKEAPRPPMEWDGSGEDPELTDEEDTLDDYIDDPDGDDEG